MSELWNLISNSTTWTRPAGLVLLLVLRLFPLLSPAHDGNEAHCEDILANGGGGFCFSVRWVCPDGRVGKQSGKWATPSATDVYLMAFHPLQTLGIRGGRAGLRYDVFR